MPKTKSKTKSTKTTVDQALSERVRNEPASLAAVVYDESEMDEVQTENKDKYGLGLEELREQIYTHLMNA